MQQLRTKVQQLESQGVKVGGVADVCACQQLPSPQCARIQGCCSPTLLHAEHPMRNTLPFPPAVCPFAPFTTNRACALLTPHATAAIAPTPQGRLAAATASSSTNPRSSGGGAVGLGATGGGSGISLEEAAALRKELEQTEVLLRGYQQENEAATRRIKVGLRGC